MLEHSFFSYGYVLIVKHTKVKNVMKLLPLRYFTHLSQADSSRKIAVLSAVNFDQEKMS